MGKVLVAYATPPHGARCRPRSPPRTPARRLARRRCRMCDILVAEAVVNPCTITYEPDLRCHPNYSFEIGDVDGDGRAEMVALNQHGNRLRIKLDGRVMVIAKHV